MVEQVTLVGSWDQSLWEPMQNSHLTAIWNERPGCWGIASPTPRSLGLRAAPRGHSLPGPVSVWEKALQQRHAGTDCYRATVVRSRPPDKTEDIFRLFAWPPSTGFQHLSSIV